jgi:thiol-disulfide isomerase/thioredoxin
MNTLTKGIYIIAIVGLLSAIIIRRNQPRSGYFKPGSVVDDFPVKNVDNGKIMPLSEVLDGKPAALHIFSTTCGVCMREWPKLKSLQNTYSRDMKLVPIGIDHLSNLKRLASSRPLGTPIYRGGHQARDAMPVPHYPFTLFVDEDLRLIRDHSGVLGHKAYAKAVKAWRNQQNH